MRFHTELSALARLSLAAAVGVVVGLLTPGRWEVHLLAGWCGFALGFLLLAWWVVLSCSSLQTRHLATREDNSRTTASLLILLGSLASLIGVFYVLSIVPELQKSGRGGLAAFITVLGISTVILSWALVHTTYIFRYARLYYQEPEGGINYNSDDHPDYLDFAYLAFTIGMTYQVSDTNISKRTIRRSLLSHALISYAFGTVLVALTINTVAGLLQ